MKRTKHAPAVFAAALILLLSTESAYANAASFFTYKTTLHLFIGNGILGLFEGLLIAKVFKTRKTRAILFMIGANYFSAWIGFLGLLWLGSQFKIALSILVTVNNIYYFVWLLFLVACFVTVILEWPFCLFTLWQKNKRSKQALYASLLAQGLSYILLLIFNSPFGHFCGSPHGKRYVDFAPVKTFVDTNDATIYFISASDGDLYQVKLDGSSKKKIATLDVTNPEMRLVAKSDSESGLWTLCVQERPIRRRRLATPPVDTGITVSGFTQSVLDLDPNELYDYTRIPALDLRPVEQQDFEVSTGWLGVSWLDVKKKKEKDKYAHRLARLQFDDTILHWSTCNATVLPNDEIVYQIGNQIVLFDLKEYKLGLITLGRGPVVFLDGKTIDPEKL